jgi:hypothetical protein
MPKRPTEHAAEGRLDCPHAELAARAGHEHCRICGAVAQYGRLGYGPCSWSVQRPAPAGEPGLAGVHPQGIGPERPVLPPGAVAKGGGW